MNALIRRGFLTTRQLAPMVARPGPFLARPTAHTFVSSRFARYPRLIRLTAPSRRFSSQLPPSQPQVPPQFQETKAQGKFKRFMKKYGYVGVGVYLAFSVVDLSLTMATIQVYGAHRVQQMEHYVLTKARSIMGLPPPPPLSHDAQQNTKPSWTTLFVLAYGIHKTILLPVRLSLTMAVTPAVSKKLVKYGFLKATPPAPRKPPLK
ncbi:hypothetical protein BC940DRAFT_303097 [Gongronella butleri]|nr:hypothetical protein BC940DRAFT_303097 [Gongronella butleri]